MIIELEYNAVKGAYDVSTSDGVTVNKVRSLVMVAHEPPYKVIIDFDMPIIIEKIEYLAPMNGAEPEKKKASKRGK